MRASSQCRSRLPESDSSRPTVRREVVRDIVENLGVKTITTTETFTQPMSHQQNAPEPPQVLRIAQRQQPFLRTILEPQTPDQQQFMLAPSACYNARPQRKGNYRRRPQNNGDLLDRLRSQLAQVERTRDVYLKSICI